jgi:hypothetical protein
MYIWSYEEESFSMEKEKQVVGDNRNNDFQGFVLDDSPKTVEEQLEIIKKYLERSMPRRENE